MRDDVQTAPTTGQSQAPAPEIMIAMRSVAKSFGPKDVLVDVNLEAPRGQSLVIIGGSGTGKSVTIKTIIGLIEPNEGEIWVDGTRVDRRRRGDALLARFGMLFQGGALFDSLSVWENVAFRLRQDRSKTAADCKEIAVEKLRRVGLTPDVADQFPAELSGGMQKRVGLARAIAAEPEIIFFDEPTTGLDPIMSGVINELIRELVVEMGATAMTITHDMSSVRAIADRVAMLHEGVIQWEGPVAEIDSTLNPYVRQFVNGLAEGPIEAVR